MAATVEELGLGQKRHSLAKTLSGGQKRKLSVGIALIGGSKVIGSWMLSYIIYIYIYKVSNNFPYIWFSTLYFLKVSDTPEDEFE